MAAQSELIDVEHRLKPLVNVKGFGSNASYGKKKREQKKKSKRWQ